jgi:DNA-binding LacI/PurR family transcriptional regulator
MTTYDDCPRYARPVTLFDIALRCGVSKMTVSLALRGSDKLKPATIERIQQVAREMGYDPAFAHAGRILSSRRQHGKTVVHHVIALFSAMAPAYQSMFCAVLHGMQAVLAPQRMAVLTVANVGDTQPLPEAVIRGDLDGMVFFGPSSHNEAMLRRLRQLPALAKTPAVSLLHPLPECRHVPIDVHAASALRFEHLLQQGHRKFLKICDDASPCMPSQLQAVQQGCAAQGLDYAAHVHHLEWRAEHARSLASECADRCRQQAISAVLAPSDTIALQVLHALWLQGLRVPEDVNVIGFGEDGSPDANHEGSALTTVRLPWCEAGQRAAAMLLAQITGDHPVEDTTLSPALMVRDTSAPPPDTLHPGAHTATARLS